MLQPIGDLRARIRRNLDADPEVGDVMLADGSSVPFDRRATSEAWLTIPSPKTPYESNLDMNAARTHRVISLTSRKVGMFKAPPMTELGEERWVSPDEAAELERKRLAKTIGTRKLDEVEPDDDDEVVAGEIGEKSERNRVEIIDQFPVSERNGAKLAAPKPRKTRQSRGPMSAEQRAKLSAAMKAKREVAAQ